MAAAIRITADTADEAEAVLHRIGQVLDTTLSGRIYSDSDDGAVIAHADVVVPDEHTPAALRAWASRIARSAEQGGHLS